MQLNGFDDRVALVTGGARGIGRAITERLRDLGARVAVGDLRAPEIDGVLGLELDVTSEASVDAAFARVEAELGAPAILVLNAGIFVIEPFEETTLASWQRTIDVNLTGAFLCARRALPAMREAGYGRIVAIGSSAGKTGGAKAVAAYGASKAGVMTLAKAIASEYAPHGVTSNALAPSLIDTEMISSMPDMASKVPVGRLGTVDDVADTVAFLCSAHAGYITGEVVDVNGGFLID
ncbi:MAG TPA: SDR family NAD(P)-dependent oxidoreductase [Capillimicrobium sp.]|nr:SDR family NAD(P)-dependent oxidoreductase [Capillimicrobium sp.]